MRLFLILLVSMVLVAEESLKKELDEHYQLFLEEASPTVIQAVNDDLQERISLNMQAKIPKVGDLAIDFSLKNINGEDFTLYKALKEKPVVLFWYRGGWCPYCNMQLTYYQKHYEAISKAGAMLVGVAPENKTMGVETKEDNEISFELLTDPNNTVAKKYNLVYKVKPTLYSLIDQRFELKDYYGEKNGELPLTILYVIDKKGVIRYAFIDEDFSKRAEPKEFLETLKRLKEK